MFGQNICPLLVHLMIASNSNLTGNVRTHSLVGVMVKDMDEYLLFWIE